MQPTKFAFTVGWETFAVENDSVPCDKKRLPRTPDNFIHICETLWA